MRRNEAPKRGAASADGARIEAPKAPRGRSSCGKVSPPQPTKGSGGAS